MVVEICGATPSKPGTWGTGGKGFGDGAAGRDVDPNVALDVLAGEGAETEPVAGEVGSSSARAGTAVQTPVSAEKAQPW